MSGPRGESGRAAAWVVAGALAVALGALLLRARSASQDATPPASSTVESFPAREQAGPVPVQVESADEPAKPALLLAPDPADAAAERRLSGRVHDPSGAPIAGAAVVVMMRSLDRAEWPSATSAQDGTYEVRFAGDWPWIELSATANGCVPGAFQLPLPAGMVDVPGQDLELRRETALEGRILWDDGTPCADAQLRVQRPVAAGERGWAGTNYVLATTRTDDDGSYRATLGGDQVVELALEAGAYRPLDPVRVHLPASGVLAQFLVVPRPASLLVHLRGGPDELFAATPGRRTSLVLTVPDQLRAGRGAPLTSRDVLIEDVDPSPPWQLVLGLPDGSLATLRDGVRLEPGVRAELDCELDAALLDRLAGTPPERAARTMSFEWRLTDVAGETLSLHDFSRIANLSGSGHVPAQAISRETGERGVVLMDIGGTSSMSGRGEVLGVTPPVDLELRIGQQLVRRGPLFEGGSIEVVVPEPEGCAMLRVLLTDARGAPRVPSLFYVSDLQRGGVRLVFPDHATGSARVLLPPGEYVVRADVPGTTSRARRVQLAAGEERTLELAAGLPGLVRGRLEPPPPPGTLVSVQAHPAEGSGFGLVPRTIADAEGRFELAGLAAGEWLLVALASASTDAASAVSTASVNVEEAWATDVVLARAGEPGRAVHVRKAGGGLGLLWITARERPLQLGWALAPGQERRVVLPSGRYLCVIHDDSVEGWPLEAPPPPFEFEIRDDDPPEALLIDA